GSAFALYGLFWVGHALMVALFPGASAFVNAVYTRRAEAPAWLIALLLAVWIGPAEEVFWRGILQRYLQMRLQPIWDLSSPRYSMRSCTSGRGTRRSSWLPSLPGWPGVRSSSGRARSSQASSPMPSGMCSCLSYCHYSNDACRCPPDPW
ncbi:MAG: CPBP family intramembrane glutamic endopeptidase, partial [Bacteroidota bacterium]|nr:CPBP family intramembrane glutamic endopeptidase [Bacteroidota bacterium]